MSDARLPLSERPRLLFAVVLKWACILVATAAAGLLVIGMIIGWEIELLAATENDDGVYIFLGEWVGELFALLIMVLIPWLLAIIIDLVDQMVWLNANRTDQEHILASRRRK